MLIALREALARERGIVRIDELARRLGTEPAVVAAMLGHGPTRHLVGADVRVELPSGCTVSGCRPVAAACRHCPLAAGKPVAAPESS